MTILFTNDQPMNPLYGGIERVTDILAKAMVKAGHTVYYYTFQSSSQALSDYPFPAEIHMLPHKKVSHPENKQVYLHFLQEKGIDLIINQRGLMPKANFFISDLPSHIKVISVFHNRPFGYWDKYWQTLFANHYGWEGVIKTIIKGMAFPYFLLYSKSNEYKRLKQQLEYAIAKSDKAIFLSQQYVDLAQKRCVADARKMMVIPNPNTYSTISQTPKEPWILYVGRLDARQKQSMQILKIWEPLEKQHPEWRLIIVGHGDQEQRMRHWANRHQLQHVEFVGKQDPQPYYEKSRLMLLVSHFEGFPMVVTESMQHGVVPIVRNSFCAQDIIEDDISGEIIRSNDISDYVSILDGLMNDEPRIDIMAQSAQQKVKQFDQDKIINQWFQLLSQYSM